MEDAAAKTLFYPFVTEMLSPPEGRVLYLNARYDAAMDDAFTAAEHVTAVQPFAPFANDMEHNGFSIVPEMTEDDESGAYDAVFMLGTKNMTELHYDVARALNALKDGGLFICAAANDEGGKRLPKDIAATGLVADSASKHKSRVVWGVKENKALNKDVLAQWLEDGAPQLCDETGFYTEPGLFSWHRIDQGSQMLTDYLTAQAAQGKGLRGRGADFGCGYGYLSCALLAEARHKIKALDYIDADARAIKACHANIEKSGNNELFANGAVKGYWQDLTKPLPKEFGPYDFIVMNPPFHEGKKTMPLIGQAFIRYAYGALCKAGVLYMVANRHLPYEDTLRQTFGEAFENIHEEGGFKLFKAVKR